MLPTREALVGDILPADIFWDYDISGAHIAVGFRISTSGRNAALKIAQDIKENAPASYDGFVRGTQVLTASIDNRSHAFLDRQILSVDSLDAGISLGPLNFAVDQPVVLSRAMTRGRFTARPPAGARLLLGNEIRG